MVTDWKNTKASKSGKKQHKEKSKKKKEYVPIIIDRDAFERTKCTFEKEKKEEEERINQERYQANQIFCFLFMIFIIF